MGVVIPEEARQKVTQSPEWQEKIELANDDKNRFAWDQADRSRPNDFIVLNHREMEKLEDLWTRFLPPDSEFADKVLIPSDLLLAGTIPLTDVILELDMDGDGKMYRFRIVIFEDYRELIQRFLNEKTDGCFMVGMCIRQFTDPGTGNEIGFPITISKNNNFINNVEEMFYRKVPNGYKQDRIPKMLAAFLQAGALSIWYGVQLALLNPVTKEAFTKDGKEKYKDSVSVNNGKSYRKGPTRYVRRLKMNEENFNKLLRKTDREYTRHTLAWRVIGHWRHYKNGRSVFIKPYWKGLMKDIQKADYKERKVIVPDAIDPIVREAKEEVMATC